MFKWESKLVRIATKIVDVLILNTLFIITSLPMFTFGASWISCIEVSKKVFDESCTSVVVEYFKTFKSNFSRGVGLTFPFLVTVCLLVINLFLVSQSLIINIILNMSSFVLFIYLTKLLFFTFPYAARYTDSVANSLKMSTRIAFQNSLSFLLLLIGMFLFTLFMLSNGLYLFVFVYFCSFGGLALFAFASSKISLKLFLPYE